MHETLCLIRSAKIFEFNLRRDHQKISYERRAYEPVDDIFCIWGLKFVHLLIPFMSRKREIWLVTLYIWDSIKNISMFCDLENSVSRTFRKHLLAALFSWLPDLLQHWKKKSCHFDLKSWVTGGTKNRLRIPSTLRIFESNWHSISSEFDSYIIQSLGIPGRILVPRVTQFLRSKWLHLFFERGTTRSSIASCSLHGTIDGPMKSS